MGFTHSEVKSSAAAYSTGANPVCAMPETTAVMLVIRLKCSTHIMKYTKAKIKPDASNGIARITDLQIYYYCSCTLNQNSKKKLFFNIKNMLKYFQE